jgi:cytochrome c553
MNRTLTLTLAAAALGLLLLGAAPPRREAPPSSPVQAEQPDLVEKGKKKCQVCHGPALCGKAKTPAIAGLPKAKVLRALNSPPGAMKAVLRPLAEPHRRALAEWVGQMEKSCPPDKYK